MKIFRQFLFDTLFVNEAYMGIKWTVQQIGVAGNNQYAWRADEEDGMQGLEYINWSGTEPLPSGEYCSVIGFSGGKWQDKPCDSKKMFICERMRK